MEKVRSMLRAGGWLTLFFASALIVSAVVTYGGLALGNQYITDCIVSCELCLESAMGRFSAEALVRYGFLSQAANFTMLLLFLSYIPVIAYAGVKAWRRRDQLRKPQAHTMLFAIALAAFANLVLEALVVVASPLIPQADSDLLDYVMMLSTGGDPYTVIVVAGIFAPIVEEIVLRGGVQKSLQSVNPTFAIVFTAVVFGVLHGNLVQGIFAGAMGLLLGYVFYKTDNIAYSIAMHVTVNLTGCFISISALPEMPVYAAVAGAAMAVLALFLLARKVKPVPAVLKPVSANGQVPETEEEQEGE